MAQESLVVVGTELTSDMVEAGKNVVNLLDAAHVRLNGAFWFLASDLRAWRLFLVTPLVDQLGTRAVYRQTQNLVSRAPKDQVLVSTKDISLLGPKAPLVVLLRIGMTTGPGIFGVRFSENTINGTFIQDAYIYRLMKAA